MTSELSVTPTLLVHKPQFKKAIYLNNMKAIPEMIEGTINLFKRYKIRWVPNSKGNGVYIPGQLLSVAKGKSKDDLGKRVKESSSNITAYLTSINQPKPFMKKLIGKELDNFKQIWFHYNNEDLGRVGSLWVVDWTVAYLYLSQGLTIPSLSIAAPTNTPKVRRKRPITSIWPNIKDYNFNNDDEVTLVAKIGHLSLYQHNLDVTLESTVENYFAKDVNDRRTRRFDLALRNFLNRDINIFEFKKDTIRIEHVQDIIVKRNYLDIIKKKYRGRTTSLIFSSPNGCTPEALRYIKSIKCCSFMNTQDLIEMIVRNIEIEAPPQGWWYYTNEVIPRIFPSLTNSNIVQLKRAV